MKAVNIYDYLVVGAYFLFSGRRPFAGHGPGAWFAADNGDMVYR